MVLRKTRDCVFNGYDAPFIPRAPRSVRRRSLQKKAVADSQICAFELLAAVAGKLLQETESSASSNAEEGKDELDICRNGTKLEEGKALKSECLDLGSSAESIFVSKLQAQGCSLNGTPKEFAHAESDSIVGYTSIVTSYNSCKTIGFDVKSENHESKNALGDLSLKKDEGASQSRKLGNDNKKNQILASNTCSYKDRMDPCVKPDAFSADRRLKSSNRFPVLDASFPRHRKDVNIGISDDDENLARHNQPTTKIRAFRPRSRIAYRRIRKFLTSKYWKVAPKLKDCELSNNDGGVKPVYRTRKTLLTYERFQHEYLSKRRKLSSDIASSESISNIPEKSIKAEKGISATILHRGNGELPPVVGHQDPCQSRDAHVKFSIKSFRVPELCIEVPETSTVGSLKRTIMEAVTAILSEGSHVGVLLQGKKIRDDNRTLLQTGISHAVNLDNLGFTLEPTSSQDSPLFSEETQSTLPCDLARTPASPFMGSGFSTESIDLPPVTSLENHVESNLDLVPLSTARSTDRTALDSKALVTVSAMSVEALTIVPMNHKTRRSELGQRRTRRPFSVTEVEALVEAVETLGTGRWRDVKLRAFDNADHRTYVDLKDKWKTLVHTASISPQQRRGEPVPQELLDRVLSAHAYWSSNHQSKQHSKHQAEPLTLIEPQVEV